MSLGPSIRSPSGEHKDSRFEENIGDDPRLTRPARRRRDARLWIESAGRFEVLAGESTLAQPGVSEAAVTAAGGEAGGERDAGSERVEGLGETAPAEGPQRPR